MTELEQVLSAFGGATACQAGVWVSGEGDPPVLRLAAVTPGGVMHDWSPPMIGGPPAEVASPRGPVLVAAIPGPRRAWLTVGPCSDVRPLQHFLDLLLPVVSQFLQSELEVEHAASELAERYEEINLLYTITEILGRTVRLEEAAATILREISETVGARRGSILVHDRVTDTLQPVAALGAAPVDIPPIALEDARSISAQVFREQRAMVSDDSGACDAEAPYRRGAMLSVPIMWTTPGGAAEPLGVVNLSDRSTAVPFTAGDQKLITAIATQIGTAIQNARLVRASLNQQQLVQELALAHDLQMKLLPRAEIVAPVAEAAARVVPAESVGGDFYNLFRLGHGRTGVMIGDVSSHGYHAALIMALVMSASAIHAQGTEEPAEMLGAVLDSLREELTSTEMFLSGFYGIIDRDARRLCYSNTGHPHAFVIQPAGDVHRLAATDPPLGMVENPPSSASHPWARGADLLLLFTDGVSDARNRYGVRFGEERVLDAVLRYRDEPVRVIVDGVFAELTEHMGEAVQRDDAAVVVVRS